MSSKIWRDSNSIPTSDIIQFNDGTLPDATGNMNQSDITLTSAVSINTKPKGKLDELQDTGFSSLTFAITGFITNASTSSIPTVIKTWLLEDKTTASFPFGRFGIVLEDFPIYNIHPNSNRGCMVTDWTWIREGQTKNKAGFVATVRFNSNLTGLNSGASFVWTGA
jgi:hypothetical protein|tara:strand:+ start:1296 stop:1793 length:498 start_codon:yes stop_codon:yes gene_type:complete